MRTAISALEERLESATARGLAHAVSRAIRDGEVQPGDRLPPIREVARELMLSPTTVAAAWQLLVRSGMIRTAGRRGTVVLGVGSNGGRYTRALRHELRGGWDLSTGIPDPGLLPDLQPVVAGLNLDTTPSSYLADPVLPALRDRVLSSLPLRAEDLLVVDGATDGLDLVIRTVLGAGDRVVVEDPAFPPLLDLLEARGIDVIGVPLDDEGLLVEPVAAAVAAGACAVFLQPRSQNPTGISMSEARAEELAAALRPWSALIVEDDSTAHVASSGPLSLGRWLPDQVVHLLSFSKSYGPDLRLAAVGGPADLIQPLARARAMGQGWSSRLLQGVLLGLLDDPRATEQVETARKEYSRRRQLVAAALRESGVPTPGVDGLNLWVPVRDEAAAVLRLASQGIAVAPGGPFAVRERVGPAGHLRVTSGLVREGHAELAEQLQAAADVQAYTAQHR